MDEIVRSERIARFRDTGSGFAFGAQAEDDAGRDVRLASGDDGARPQGQRVQLAGMRL
ncbi:Rv2993c-like domain-containing protein [Microbispora rosea]